jgi:hypothetical protein
MTKTELARLAAAVNVLRPEWPTSSLTTYLALHGHRPLRDVAVALVWVATDPDTKTPKRMDEAGPWWSASRTSDAPQRDNDCPRHRHSRLRLDPVSGRTVCGGCWADDNDAPLPPMSRGGRPIPPEARELMLAALHPQTEVADV